MKSYKCEVFDSDGALAIQGPDGQDVAHLLWVDRATATDEYAEPTWRALTDAEKQSIIDRVVMVMDDHKARVLREALEDALNGLDPDPAVYTPEDIRNMEKSIRDMEQLHKELL